MRDVSNKPNTLRTAKAESFVHCRPETIAAIRSGNVPKADPIGVAKVAAIQGAKNTSMLIPYCHQVPLDFVGVNAELGEKDAHFVTEVKAVWKTGVEMEALVAASAAALTFYDMLKIIDETMEVGSIRLIEKKGGKSDFKLKRTNSIKAGVVVLSDKASTGQREDLSGKAIKGRLEKMGVEVVAFSIIPDELKIIENELRRLCKEAAVDLVLTTGGTGVGPRDVTPEATSMIIDRELPGVEEFLRGYGQERTRYSMLGRGVAGICGNTIIVNLPGSPGGVKDAIDILFPWLLHAYDVLKGEEH